MISIGELKVFIEPSNNYVGFVDSWLEIAMQLKHTSACSLQAFVRLELMRSENIISNWYELQRNLFTFVVREYIVDNLTKTCAANT